MKNFSLLIISFFLVFGISAQNVYEITITSYSNSRDLKDVLFELYQNNEKVIEQESNSGMFQFIMKAEVWKLKMEF